MTSTTAASECLEPFGDKIEDYDLESLIGNGSFGRVYEAVCKKNGRRCAIKRIAKKSSKHQVAPTMAKINAEVTIHLRLKHPHILELFNVLEDDDFVYLVLELCPGGSLNQFVKKLLEDRNDLDKYRKSKSDDALLKKSSRSGCRVTSRGGGDAREFVRPLVPFRLIRCILSQLCECLLYLHSSGIVHRDLNLNNILLLNTPSLTSPSVTIKICDFGLALDLNSAARQVSATPHKSSTSMPDGKTICGTPGFISPEVWSQSEPASTSSDLFSVGSITYSLITGLTPKGDLVGKRLSSSLSHLLTSSLAGLELHLASCH